MMAPLEATRDLLESKEKNPRPVVVGGSTSANFCIFPKIFQLFSGNFEKYTDLQRLSEICRDSEKNL